MLDPGEGLSKGDQGGCFTPARGEQPPLKRWFVALRDIPWAEIDDKDLDELIAEGAVKVVEEHVFRD